MMEGRALMEESVMAITNGEDAAVPDLRLRRGSEELTRRPMMKVPRM